MYLFVAFVPCQSRTEANCDYVAFYDDLNHVKRWGEERYSGRDGAENWPGFGGRPPLEVREYLCVCMCLALLCLEEVMRSQDVEKGGEMRGVRPLPF